MKVYVEEKNMPKSCLECDYENCEHQYIECFLDERHPNCPLQSLTDYTKQVRKEVIEKVCKVLEQAIPHDLCWSWAVIKKELDQIQGEKK